MLRHLRGNQEHQNGVQRRRHQLFAHREIVFRNGKSSRIQTSFQMINYLFKIEKGRLYLSADTAAEMNQWISQIRMVMTSLRDGGSSDATDVSDTGILFFLFFSYCVSRKGRKKKGDILAVACAGQM